MIGQPPPEGEGEGEGEGFERESRFTSAQNRGIKHVKRTHRHTLGHIDTHLDVIYIHHGKDVDKMKHLTHKTSKNRTQILEKHTGETHRSRKAPGGEIRQKEARGSVKGKRWSVDV